MKPKIIVITGYLAAGKSAFARRLSKETNIPCLIKDTFKIALCENVSVTNREESRLFSSVTFDGIMYVAERFMETGSSLIIEGNFAPAGLKKTDEAGVIKRLIEKYSCLPLTYKFTGDTKILHKRYIERDKQPERGKVNAMLGDIPYDEFDMSCRNLDAFEIGGDVITIDATDFCSINFEQLVDSARIFLVK